MSNLPKGWVEKKIGDVAELINGDRGKNYPSQDQQLDDGYCLFLNTPNVKHGRFNFSNTKFITKEQHESLRNGTLNRNDIVLTIRGTLGNCAVYTDDVDFKTVRINSAMMIVRPSIAIHPWYLTRILSSSAFLEWSQKNHRGSAQPHLRATDIKEYPIFFPAIAEQKRIVEKLDEVLAQVDIIKARLDGIPDLLKRFRQSILASAVSGKLTEEWRGLHQFKAKNQLQKIKDKTPAKPPKDELAKFSELPHSWEWALVKQVGTVQLGRQRAPKYHSGDNMRPYLRVANVMEGYIDTSDIMEMDFDKSDFEKYKLYQGDILLNEGQSHELVGRPSMFNNEVENVCFTNTLVRFRAHSGLLNKFSYLVFLNQMKIGRFQEIASRTVNISHLGAGRFADMEFPFPPIEEQKEIVRLVDQYFAVADTIEAQVKKAQARVDNLTQSILAKAFRGELVAQDPNDEPADKLLERIAEARKEAEALAKAAKKAEAAKKRAAKSA